MTFALVTYYAEAFALLLLPKSSEAQPRQTRERNTCLRYNLFLMYDEPRSVPVPSVRRPLSIGPGLCELPTAGCVDIDPHTPCMHDRSRVVFLADRLCASCDTGQSH